MNLYSDPLGDSGLTVDSPEVRSWVLESGTHSNFAVDVPSNVGDSAFLFMLSHFIRNEDRVAQGHFGLKSHQPAARVHKKSGGFLVERAFVLGPAVDQYRYVEGYTLP